MELHASAHVDTFTRDHLPRPETWPELVFDLPERRYPPALNCASSAALPPGKRRRSSAKLLR